MGQGKKHIFSKSSKNGLVKKNKTKYFRLWQLDERELSWVRSPGQTFVTGNVKGKSCTGGITLKNVSVLHSYFNQINNKTLTPNSFLYWTLPQHNRKYHDTALSSSDHFLNQSAFRKLDTNQSQVLKFNQAFGYAVFPNRQQLLIPIISILIEKFILNYKRLCMSVSK